MPIVVGRQMDDATCEVKGEEILELLRMWGVSRADAYVMCRHMKYKCQNMPDKEWTDPLEGSGMRAEGFNALAKPENFSFDKPN